MVIRRRLWLLVGALGVTMMLGTRAHAQEMVEVPTPPEVRERIVGPPLPALVAAPSALEPLPPPIVAPPPPLAPTEWRVRRHMDLAYVGLGVFGGAYATNLIAGLSTRIWELDVPFAGPWLTMQRLHLGSVPNLVVILALDSLVQACGPVLVVVGSAWKRRVRERVQ